MDRCQAEYGWCIGREQLTARRLIKQRFNLLPQRVVARARLRQKPGALADRSRRRGVIEPVDLRPAIRIHAVPPPRSSRSSHAFASFESRITVSGDTLS